MPAFSLRPSGADRRIARIELSRIAASPYQPRRSIDEASIQELAESIRRFGLLTPLLVRRCTAGEYELIAGERRLRALKTLGWTHADAIVLSAYDRDCALIGLIENLEREDLHYLDEAEACRRILHEHGLTQEELASVLSMSPSALANRLRLLRLSVETRAFLRESGLSERHARALLKLEDGQEQLEFARLAVKSKWSVRQLEGQIAHSLNAAHAARAAKPELRLIRDNRLVINALNDTVRQLKRIGVHASSRVEAHGDSYDVIITVRRPYDAEN